MRRVDEYNTIASAVNNVFLDPGSRRPEAEIDAQRFVLVAALTMAYGSGRAGSAGRGPAQRGMQQSGGGPQRVLPCRRARRNL